MVVSVPCAFTLGEVVTDGVVLANVVGVDIVAYVVLTHLDAFALHLKNDASARARIEWFEAADRTVDGAILGAVHNGVVAKGVVRGEEVDPDAKRTMRTGLKWSHEPSARRAVGKIALPCVREESSATDERKCMHSLQRLQLELKQ